MIAMHAAVWSQPIVCHKLRRSERTTETPETTAGKTVLGTGIALTLLGGLLAVMGLTGYFMRGDTRYFIGFGTLPGMCSLFSGLLGVRAVGHSNSTRRHFFFFVLLCLVTMMLAVSMVALGTLIFLRDTLMILPSVITGTIILMSSLITVLSCVAGLAGIQARHDTLDTCPRPSNLGNRPSDPMTSYRPTLLASASPSPETTVSPVSDPEG